MASSTLGIIRTVWKIGNKIVFKDAKLDIQKIKLTWLKGGRGVVEGGTLIQL